MNRRKSRGNVFLVGKFVVQHKDSSGISWYLSDVCRLNDWSIVTDNCWEPRLTAEGGKVLGKREINGKNYIVVLTGPIPRIYALDPLMIRLRSKPPKWWAAMTTKIPSWQNQTSDLTEFGITRKR